MANSAIYRYEVAVGPTVEIALRGPILPGAIAARQHDRVEFWAAHDPEHDPYVAKFVVMATGPELTKPGELLGHIGTAITCEGQFRLAPVRHRRARVPDRALSGSFKEAARHDRDLIRHLREELLDPVLPIAHLPKRKIRVAGTFWRGR